MSGIGHNCGVGLVNSPHDAYDMLQALSNRGDEAAGIAVDYRNRADRSIDIFKWIGKPNGVKKVSIIGHLGTDGVYVVHTRYSTKRQDGEKYALAEAHPRYLEGSTLQERYHLVARGVDLAVVHNGTFCYDPRMIHGEKPRTDTEAFLMLYRSMGPEAIIKETPGSFSVALFDKYLDETVVMRDVHETKPLVLGRKDGKFVAASEDSAIRSIGGMPIRDVNGGEIIYVSRDGKSIRSHQISKPDPHPCHFELIYIMRDESTYYGVPVGGARHRMGEMLRSLFYPQDTDIVTYLPNAPRMIAWGYDEARFAEVFYKIKDEREFQRSSDDARIESLNSNLFVYDKVELNGDKVDLKGKNIVVIDDSIVRGHATRKAAELLRSREVGKLYFISATPPIGANGKGCDHGGVDMPSDSDSMERAESRFASRRYVSANEWAGTIGADGIFFTPFKSYIEWLGQIGMPSCKRCIGGPHPYYPNS